MLLQETKELLQKTKNLLAFSAGVDSTALFFLLQKANISFDIAIVDYGIRKQSKEEVSYAKELAQAYNLNCYVLEAEKVESNFEANARKQRYDFFQKLIDEHKYKTVLTAHHLGDRFEWMLMQFCKGAGSIELSGMAMSEDRLGYKLIRPLLHLPKEQLLSYLQENQIKYFEDESNTDERYKRNKFRKLASPLLQEYSAGIAKSFQYLDQDIQNLLEPIEVQTINKFAYFTSTASRRSDIFAVDKYLKSQGHIISANERALLAKESTVVLGRKVVVHRDQKYVFIAPYIHKANYSKEFKEKMRLLKIEPKLRGYLALDAEAVFFLSELLA